MMKTFSTNGKFKRDYDKLFRHDPLAANVMLLLCELADEHGQTQTDEAELARLVAARFDDPRAYQLPGGPKR